MQASFQSKHESHPMFLRSLALAMTFCLLLPGTLWAQNINDEGAQKLKSLFEGMLNGPIVGDISLQKDGDITIEPLDDYYAITLPHLKITYPNGAYLSLGMISINATPDDVPDQWKMSFALPTPIVTLNAQGKEITRMDIGAQQGTGIWSPDIGFSKLDSTYKDIMITGTQNAYKISIPFFQIRQNLTQDENQKWSGPAYILLKNIDMNFMKLDSSAHLGELRADFMLDQYNPAAEQKYKDTLQSISTRMQEQIENQKKGQSLEPGPLEQDMLKLQNAMLDFFLNWGNGFKMTSTVSDFSAQGPAGTTNENSTLHLDKGTLALEMDGMLSDTAFWGIKINHQGFSTDAFPEKYTDFTPSDLNLNIMMKDIPVKDLSALAQNTLQGIQKNPDMKQMATLSLLMKAPAILSQAATTLEIKDSYASNATYKATLNGQVKADMSALNSATGQGKATIKGLDSLLDKAKALASDPEEKRAEDFEKLAGMLKQIKTLAKIETVENIPLYVLEFLMDAQGQMLLNGQDIKQAAPAPSHDTYEVVPAPSAGTAQ